MSAVDDELRPSFSSSRVDLDVVAVDEEGADPPCVPSVAGSVRAKTRNVPAWLPFVIHCFAPSSRQPSSVGDGRRTQGPGIRAGAGLGQRERAEHAARRELGHESLPLLLRPERDDRERDGARVHRHGDADTRVGTRQLLEHEDVGEEVRSGTPELLGHADAHQPELAELREDLDREGVLAIPRRRRAVRSRRPRTPAPAPGSHAAPA